MFLSGVLLTVVAFPSGAAAGTVPESVMRHLALIYLPISFTMNALSIAVLVFYKIDQATHERNLAALHGGQTVGDEASPQDAEPVIASAG